MTTQHFPFSICNFPFAIHISVKSTDFCQVLAERRNSAVTLDLNPPMTNEKWKMTNGKLNLSSAYKVRDNFIKAGSDKIPGVREDLFGRPSQSFEFKEHRFNRICFLR